jgi:hypothetical protein
MGHRLLVHKKLWAEMNCCHSLVEIAWRYTMVELSHSCVYPDLDNLCATAS